MISVCSTALATAGGTVLRHMSTVSIARWKEGTHAGVVGLNSGSKISGTDSGLPVNSP